MKDREKLLQRAAINANLPGESVPGSSLVELFGKNRVLIENHHGIIGYSDQRICIRSSWGEIVVEGTCLRIACMTRKQLVIMGDMNSINLNKRSL